MGLKSLYHMVFIAPWRCRPLGVDPPAATVGGQRALPGATRPQFPALSYLGVARRCNRRRPPIRRHRHGM